MTLHTTPGAGTYTLSSGQRGWMTWHVLRGAEVSPDFFSVSWRVCARWKRKQRQSCFVAGTIFACWYFYGFPILFSLPAVLRTYCHDVSQLNLRTFLISSFITILCSFPQNTGFFDVFKVLVRMDSEQECLIKVCKRANFPGTFSSVLTLAQ